MKRVCVFVVVVLGLSSCSYFGQNDANVLNSRNGGSLVIPSPLTSDNLSPYYELPAQTQNAHISLVPPS